MTTKYDIYAARRDESIRAEGRLNVAKEILVSNQFSGNARWSQYEEIARLEGELRRARAAETDARNAWLSVCNA